eukprot:5126420-Amphidinium_carterae.1
MLLLCCWVALGVIGEALNDFVTRLHDAVHVLVRSPEHSSAVSCEGYGGDLLKVPVNDGHDSEPEAAASTALESARMDAELLLHRIDVEKRSLSVSLCGTLCSSVAQLSVR